MKLSKLDLQAFVKKMKPLLIVCLAVIIVGTPVYLFARHQNEKTQLESARTAEESGHYDVAAQKLVVAYNAEKNPQAKASRAYSIGLDLYYSGNNAEGKKWMSKAASAFEALHEPNRADNARAMIERFENLGKDTSSKPDKSRGKDYAL